MKTLSIFCAWKIISTWTGGKWKRPNKIYLIKEFVCNLILRFFFCFFFLSALILVFMYTRLIALLLLFSCTTPRIVECGKKTWKTENNCLKLFDWIKCKSQFGHSICSSTSNSLFESQLFYRIWRCKWMNEICEASFLQ